MGAAIAFTDLEGFAGTSFPNVSGFEADQFYLEPEVSPEHCPWQGTTSMALL